MNRQLPHKAAEYARPIVVIVGPTASGKSAVGQLVAKRLGGEVVSADSMQIYRGMDIGTGKLPKHKRIVVHHGLDLIDPGEPYSASQYQTYARSIFRDIASRDQLPVLVGGTGFYVRAAIDAYEFPAGEQVGNKVRIEATAFAETYGAQALWEHLNKRDPQSAAVLHPNNVRRVVRAFELLESGTSYAERLKYLSSIEPAVPALLYGLSVERDVLYKRIEQRADQMLAAGLIAEVEGLLRNGFRDAMTAVQAIGYKEIVRALDGEQSLDEALSDIKRATRRYAKRQGTWFRKDRRITWIDANKDDVDYSAHLICADYERQTSTYVK